MMRNIRLFLLLEAVLFFAAASVHFGILSRGYEHHEAGVAESVIGAVLVLSLVVTWVVRRRSRAVGLAAQGFAMVGTLVGLFTIAVGVGPRTTADLVYHAGIILVLIWGLIVARHVPRQESNASGAGGSL